VAAEPAGPFSARFASLDSPCGRRDGALNADYALPIDAERGRLSGAEQSVLVPPVLRCNSFAFGPAPVILTVIARTRIDAVKLLAVRRALCASEYGGVTRIRAWCPEDGDSSSQRTKIRLSGPNGKDQPLLAPRRVAGPTRPCRSSCWAPRGRFEFLDALQAAPGARRHEYHTDRGLADGGHIRRRLARSGWGRRSLQFSG
jgi:hypothetical protein